MVFLHFLDYLLYPAFSMDVCKRFTDQTRWNVSSKRCRRNPLQRRQFYCQSSPACFRSWWDDVAENTLTSTCKTCEAVAFAIPVNEQSGPALFSCSTCQRKWVKPGDNSMLTEEACRDCGVVLLPLRVGTRLFQSKDSIRRPM